MNLKVNLLFSMNSSGRQWWSCQLRWSAEIQSGCTGLGGENRFNYRSSVPHATHPESVSDNLISNAYSSGPLRGLFKRFSSVPPGVHLRKCKILPWVCIMDLNLPCLGPLKYWSVFRKRLHAQRIPLEDTLDLPGTWWRDGPSSTSRSACAIS